jgi:phospholipid/cholesterol/gamma-HCH transport system substrate-binding protein
MSRNVLETVMGAVVLLVAVIFLAFAYSAAQLKGVTGYPLSAKFNHIDGIRPGGDVRVSGIKVGTVISATLDPKTYQAIVQLSIDNSVRLPEDTVAQVTSSSLLGDNFMELVPGASDTMLRPGATIQFTQSPTSLQSLLGQVVFSVTHPQGSGGSGSGGSQGGAAQGSTGANPAPSSAGVQPAKP